MNMKFADLKTERPPLTAMIQCKTPDACIEKIKASISDGADAIGIQLCQLELKYRTSGILGEIFDACEGKPIYITSYRYGFSEQMTDEDCAELLVLALENRTLLCDVMGDMFGHSPYYELTENEKAIQKQKMLIDEIHKKGGEVLMSSHTYKNISAEESVKIAEEHHRRGADIAKVVNRTESIEDMPECMRTINLLNQTLKKPYLYLVGGPCQRIIRHIGPNLGVCMYLCVQEHNEIDTPEQPVLQRLKAVRDNIIF